MTDKAHFANATGPTPTPTRFENRPPGEPSFVRSGATVLPAGGADKTGRGDDATGETPL